MTNLTGEHLFFRYAWPCVDIRLHQGKITEEQYRYLKFFRDNLHRRPGRKLLTTCFPNAAKDLIESAYRMFTFDPWTLEHVTEYWRHHHQGPSPTILVTVESVGVDRVWVRIDDWNIDQFLNPYSLEVKQGDRIIAHNHYAVEKL